MKMPLWHLQNKETTLHGNKLIEYSKTFKSKNFWAKKYASISCNQISQAAIWAGVGGSCGGCGDADDNGDYADNHDDNEHKKPL